MRLLTNIVLVFALSAGNAILGDDEFDEMVDIVGYCNGDNRIKSLKITGCRNDTYFERGCDWTDGQNITISYLYEAVPAMRSIKSVGWTYYMGQAYTMEVFSDSKCVVDLCPLSNDVTDVSTPYNITLKFSFAIQTSRVDLRLETRIQNDWGVENYLSCIFFNVRSN